MFKDEKIIEIKTCKKCNAKFEITDKDLEFYEKISPIFNSKKYLIPSPTFCPDCRKQRRMSFLNQMNLHKNTCNSCGQKIISRFNPESGIKNYCNECWSSDFWNQLEYGIDFNFEKSAFEQISYLIKKTPFQNLIGSASNITNNSVYTNHTSEIHNSYLVFESNTVNNCLYSYGLKNSNNIVDSYFVGNSEYTYECVDSQNLFNCFYSKKSVGCRFSYFLNNCNNCDFCIGCKNLNNKSYHIFNKEATKEEYEDLVRKLGDKNFIEKFKSDFVEFSKNDIVKSLNIVGSENCIGDNIFNSKNCSECYDILGCQDCKYCTNTTYSSDFYDVSSFGENSNKIYESVSAGRYSNNILFSDTIGKGENLIYCIDVKKSKNCFLCVNLEGKEYCILNKKYSKEEYETLVPKIIEHMKNTGEWGEFFPSSISPFGYNETIANEYFPLNKEKALNLNFNWSTYEPTFPKVDKIIKPSMLPDDISKIPDDILNWAIECEVSGKPFRIIGPELDFYRKHGISIPKKHPNERHLARVNSRNPRKIFDRSCEKCGIQIKTTYSPERNEIVYCENCYGKEIY